MSKTFKIWPKQVIKRNGLTLTPEQEIIIISPVSHTDPFRLPIANGMQLIVDAYMKKWGFDYKRAGCGPTDFNYKALD